ncbi:MAG: hypothetical protein PWP52_2019 [Bacteroidales bacterium]|nr:hypothetical protein [Bacteroidales bacterium]
MKQRIFFISVLAGIFALTACEKEATNEVIQPEKEMLELTDPMNGEIIPGQYIIVLNDDATKFKSASDASYNERIHEVKALAESMLRTKSSSEFEVLNAYAQVLKGFSAKMSEADMEELKNDGRVKYIEPDMHIMRPPWENDDVSNDSGQEVPYGIERVGYGSGVGKVAWIIDTGIDLDHEDLNVDGSRGFNAFDRGPDAGTLDDKNGHGTHCAGTVAAIDNAIGVVGIAAGATVIPVKVLDKRGSGSTSGVIAGVDYVAAHASAGDAANMSLGGGISETLDNAVINASNNGIYFALAAGNESDDANNHSPARANGQYIWTISAMDSNDYFASFSNYGNPPVDYCEPGVSIKSTWKDGGYNTISGTSMAAPHMCGILLMTNGNPVNDGYVNGDPDGNPDPIGHI